MMKKYILYFGILTAGVFLGWFFFGTSGQAETPHQHEKQDSVTSIWTCAMHSQIRQPQSGNCPICGMKLVPVTNSGKGLTANQFRLSSNAMALANIQTTMIGQGSPTANAELRLSGKITANETENTVQQSYFSGRVERLSIASTGQEVRKGQLLAQIYSPQLLAAQQELLTAASIKKSQPALYQAVRNKLKLLKLSENQINRIETSAKVRDNFPVFATVSGTVTQKLVEQGQAIKKGQILFRIANLNSVWANFDVYESQISLFKVGQEVAITCEAIPEKEFIAKIDFIEPVLNVDTRTVKVRVVLSNKERQFKPGMFVEGRVKDTQISSEQSISIPATAVLWTGKRSVVYVKTSADMPVFEMREITLGNKTGDSYTVQQGLKLGDEIVTHGAFTVDAAAQLQGKKSMMNQKGSKTTLGQAKHLKKQEKSKSGRNGTETNERIKVSVEFQNRLKTIFHGYLKIKDGLIADDLKKVVEEARKLSSDLKRDETEWLNNKSARNYWMPFKKEIKASAHAISEAKDIDEQREHFKRLSSHLTSAIRLFGINQKVYNQYCPMVNNNKGGWWLSDREEIRNPYFGAKMLNCGSVKEKIE